MSDAADDRLMITPPPLLNILGSRIRVICSNMLGL